MAVLAWATCVCGFLDEAHGSVGARWAAKNGGVGTLPAVAAWGGIGVVEPRVSFSGCRPRKHGRAAEWAALAAAAWADFMCLFLLRSVAVWACGRSGGVGSLTLAAWTRGGAVGLGGGGMGGLPFFRLGLI